MMQLKRMFVKNYMSIGSAIIGNFGDVTLFDGPNGAGKTTIADLLGIILFGQKRLAITSDRPRALHTGTRWQLGGEFRRVGEIHTYIVIELADEDGLILQGVKITTKNDNSTPKQYFSVFGKPLEMIGAVDGNRMAPDEDLFIDPNDPNVAIYETENEAFQNFFAQRKFKGAFTRDSDCLKKYRESMQSLIRNEEVKGKFYDFIKKFILPAPTAREESANHRLEIENFKKAQKEFNDYSREKEFFKNYSEAYGQYDAARAEQDQYIRLRDLVKKIGADRIIAESRQEIDRRQAEIASIEEEIRDLKQKSEQITKDILLLRQQDPEAARLEQALSDLKLQKKELEEKQKDYQEYLQAFSAFVSAIWRTDLLPERAENSLFISAWEAFKKDRSADMAKLQKEGQDAAAELDEVQEQLDAINGSLQGKGGSKATDAAELKMAINAEFERRGISARAKILYECVDGIRDETWQPAIEMLVDNYRFGLVVPPEYLKIAYAVQHDFEPAHPHNYKVHVLNTAGEPGKTEENSVYGQLLISDRHADVFLNRHYGKYILAENNDVFAGSPYALRKNGQSKNPTSAVKSGSKEKQMLLFFGLEARERQRKQLSDRAAELKEKQTLLQQKTEEIETSVKKTSLLYVNVMDCPVRNPELFSNLPGVLEEIERTQDLLKSLAEGEAYQERQKQIAALKDQKKANEIRIDDLQGEKAKHGLEITSREQAITAVNPDALLQPAVMYEDLPEADRNAVDGFLQNYNKLNFDQLEGTFSEKVSALFNTLNLVWRSMPEATHEKLEIDFLMDHPEDRSNYDRIQDMLSRMTLDIDRDKQDKLNQAIEALRSQFRTLLMTMGDDYRNAEQMRREYNSFVGRYPIGNISYELGQFARTAAGNRMDYLNAALVLSDAEEEPANMDDITERLKAAAEEDPEAFDRLFDYRQYISCPLVFREIREDGTKGSSKDVDRHPDIGSNGQQATLRYFLRIGTMAYQVYDTDSLRMILCDEATNGMDSENTRSFIGMLKDTHMQALLFSYDESLEPLVDEAFQLKTPKAGKYADQICIMKAARKLKEE